MQFQNAWLGLMEGMEIEAKALETGVRLNPNAWPWTRIKPHTNDESLEQYIHRKYEEARRDPEYQRQAATIDACTDSDDNRMLRNSGD
jgi:hypothetical protein